MAPRGARRPRHPHPHHHYIDTTSGGDFMEWSLEGVVGEPLTETQRNAPIQAYGCNNEIRDGGTPQQTVAGEKTSSSGAGQSSTSASSAGVDNILIKRTLTKQDSDAGRGRTT